jgi:hypothetical protein
MSAETLEAIGERHDLRAEEISPLKDVGIFNAIYLVGSEYVLRVPRDAPPFVAATTIRALVGVAPGGDDARDHAFLPRFAWQAVDGSVPSILTEPSMSVKRMVTAPVGRSAMF